jgi:pSer/pThr/pTyr-binding forkhead associated (FHA) protein
MTTKSLKGKTSRFAPRLTIQTGPQAGQEIIIRKDATLIGRGDVCDIVINDPLVSRRHSQVTWDGAYCAIEDLGSTNGTFVNGQRLSEPRVLKNGDQVQIAGIVIVFGDPQATLTGLKWPVLALERSASRVYVNRKPIDLSDKEFTLLAYLNDHADRFCSKKSSIIRSKA